MTPTEFVSALASVSDVERTELATVDRALAKQGLRRLARGRSRPDINLMEGIQILCAWAGAKKLTDAAQEIERQRNFVVSRDHEADELGVVYEFDTEYLELLGGSLRELSGRNFLEIVAIVAEQLREGAYPEKDIWLSIEKGGSVEVVHKHKGGDQTIYFTDLNKKTLFQPRPHVTINVVIEGPVLKWIHDKTEGA